MEASFMTTRLKTMMTAGAAVLTLAAGAPMLLAQDQQPRNRRPGVGGPPPDGAPGMPGMRRMIPGGPMGFGPGFAALDLSDDQKAQLKQIADSHRAEFEAAGEKARAAHEGMRALVESDSIDENAIRAKSQEVAAAEAEIMILNAKVRQQSMQVLTSEQLAKLKEMRDKGPGRRVLKQRGR
jgi:periplasmic protein CpxP/Spy